MIKSIVYDQEPIMYSLCCPYFYGRVLSVMPVDALTECAAYLCGIYQGRHICITIIKLH